MLILMIKLPSTLCQKKRNLFFLKELNIELSLNENWITLYKKNHLDFENQFFLCVWESHKEFERRANVTYLLNVALKT